MYNIYFVSSSQDKRYFYFFIFFIFLFFLFFFIYYLLEFMQDLYNLQLKKS